jgi:SAM-dependent methyltransferase
MNNESENKLKETESAVESNSGCCEPECSSPGQSKDAEIKEIVKQKYSKIALASEKSASNCGCCSSDVAETDYSAFNDDYSKLDGYVADADLNLGCGVPSKYAGMKAGDTVVDLGSGAGNDVFVSRALVGESGKVIGVDFSLEMVGKAFKNKAKLGFENVDFKHGEIEKLPLDENVADVVISNCVMNLVPNKEKAFSEVMRILKHGGHFCISDIVIIGELPDELRNSAAAYAGCVAGAMQKEEYLAVIKSQGFKNVEIKTTKVIELPDELLKEYLSSEMIDEFKKGDFGIVSITVVGEK